MDPKRGVPAPDLSHNENGNASSTDYPGRNTWPSSGQWDVTQESVGASSKASAFLGAETMPAAATSRGREDKSQGLSTPFLLLVAQIPRGTWSVLLLWSPQLWHITEFAE